MSDQPPIKDDPTMPPDSPRSEKPVDDSATKKLRPEDQPKPESTVTIKVLPEQGLFADDRARQATAPLRQAAVNIPPGTNVGHGDAHRTPTQRRGTAHLQQASAREQSATPPPTALLKPDSEPSTAAEHQEEDDSDPQDKTRKVPAHDGSDSDPEETGQIGMDTVALDNSLNTAIMDANCKTLVETGWRCPECTTTNRHQGPGKNPLVVCDKCGHKTTLTGELVVPLDAQPSSGEVLVTSNLVKGRSFLGKYMLDRFLGRGGMGEVWLGRHPNLDIPVAIKIMSPDLMARNASYLERFLSEARTAAQMNHPNVVRIYDADHHDGLYFIVLEYMNGGDVLQLAREAGGQLDTQEALKIVVAVAEALDEAAKFGIIHRDIKPENIMLTKDGAIKLADLGIAKRIVGNEEAEHFTFTAMILGTPAYISPEQALNASEVDIRADIYSLGATFYQLVTGTIPFPAKSPFQMMYKHVKEPLVHPGERNPELAANICAVICKMMEKDPLDRYPDTEALLVDLYRIRDRDASVMQLQASNIPAAGAKRSEFNSSSTSVFGMDPIGETETRSIWRMAPIQIAIGVAIASLALILGLQMAPEPTRAEDGMTRQLRDALLQVRRQRQVAPVPNTEQLVDNSDQQPPEQPPVVTPAPLPPTPLNNDNSKAEVAQLAEQAKLLQLRQERFQKRLAEAQTTWQRVRDAKHNPGYGVETSILKAEQLLTDGRVAAASRDWDVAISHLDTAINLSLQAETIAKDQKRAVDAIADVREARRGAIGAGAGEVSIVKDSWKPLEGDFRAVEQSLTKGDFRDVLLKAPELVRRYQHLETQTPALQELAAAAEAFNVAYEKTDRQLLETWASEELAQVERTRRLAAAETIRHTEAAKGYREAAELLAAAIALATEKRDQHQSATAAKAEEAAQIAARAKADKLWRSVAGELAELQQAMTKAARAPLTEAVAVLTAKELQIRLKEATAYTRNNEDRDYLAGLETEAKTLISRFSAAPKFGRAWLIPDLEIELLPIAKGTYLRGSPTGATDEAPTHQVTLTQNFWMGKFEISQRQFRAVSGSNPSSLTGISALPVESVTWEQAMSFCRVLNEREGKAGRLPSGYEYRLPSEAEWEYACRAGTKNKYSFGDDPALMATFGNYCDRSFSGNTTWRDTKHDDGFGKTAPIGSYQPNPWGLHDMHGNVAEWCLDRYDRYPKSEVTNPIGSGKRDERIFRGGNWTGAASLCRSAQRSAASPTYAINSIGFRIVLAPAVLLETGGGISRLLNP